MVWKVCRVCQSIQVNMLLSTSGNLAKTDRQKTSGCRQCRKNVSVSKQSWLQQFHRMPMRIEMMKLMRMQIWCEEFSHSFSGFPKYRDKVSKVLPGSFTIIRLVFPDFGCCKILERGAWKWMENESSSLQRARCLEKTQWRSASSTCILFSHCFVCQHCSITGLHEKAPLSRNPSAKLAPGKSRQGPKIVWGVAKMWELLKSFWTLLGKLCGTVTTNRFMDLDTKIIPYLGVALWCGIPGIPTKMGVAESSAGFCCAQKPARVHVLSKEKTRGAVAELLKRGRGRQGCSCWNGQFWLITFGTKDLTLDYSCKKKMSVFQSPVAEVKLSVQLLTTAPPQRPAVRRRTWTLDAMPRWVCPAAPCSVPWMRKPKFHVISGRVAQHENQ